MVQWDRAGPGVPRALFVTRHPLRKTNVSHLIHHYAVTIGFAILEVALENFTPREQVYLLWRSDAVIGVHGAGLGLHFLMNTEGKDHHCRTLIELKEWAHPYWMVHYRQLAIMAKVALVEVVPVSVRFDRKERPADRSRHRVPFNSFRKPHRLFFSNKDVTNALDVARANWARCTR